MQTVFEAAGGNEGLRRLAAAWHRRVMDDEVVSHTFSQGFHPQHVERLAVYWAEALGGPNTYSESYGDETTVVRIHSGNGEHDEMNRRAIACFDQALVDTGLADDGALRQALHDYFAWATTTTMSRYHHSADDVPEDLGIPSWSWDGLQACDSTAGHRLGLFEIVSDHNGPALRFRPPRIARLLVPEPNDMSGTRPRRCFGFLVGTNTWLSFAAARVAGECSARSQQLSQGWFHYLAMHVG